MKKKMTSPKAEWRENIARETREKLLLPHKRHPPDFGLPASFLAIDILLK